MGSASKGRFSNCYGIKDLGTLIFVVYISGFSDMIRDTFYQFLHCYNRVVRCQRKKEVEDQDQLGLGLKEKIID